MRAGQIVRSLFVLALVLIGMVTSGAIAQTTLPGTAPPPPPTPLWYTPAGIGQPSEGFPTPDQACRRQHEAYNPNATHQPQPGCTTG